MMRGAERDTAELKALRDAGLSQPRAAARLGITQSCLSKLCTRRGIRWPRVREVRVRWGNELLTLHELARRESRTYSTVYERYQRGLRGAELVREPSYWNRRSPKEYHLGLTVEDWRTILAQVDALESECGERLRARKRVARSYRIPVGAIGAAERGEWHRLT